MRVAITQEFQVISVAGEKYTVEEYTYFELNDDPNHIQRPCKKMFSLKDPRPDHNFQAVDHISGDVYAIRLTGESLTQIPISRS
jgi:hypothetical protein